MVLICEKRIKKKALTIICSDIEKKFPDRGEAGFVHFLI